MYRVAVAGLGSALRSIHLPAYRALQRRLTVVGGFDIDALARTHAAESWPGVPLFENLEEMIETVRPDIVAVCTPPAQHHSQCLLALRMGCHVFCEKPMVESLTQADEVIEAAAQFNRHVVVNCQFPFMKIHAAAKRMIGLRQFGQLLFMHASQTFRPTEHTEAAWRGTMERRLGLEFGVHVFELVRFFFGEEPIRLFGHMPRPDVAKTPEVITAVSIEFSRGRAANVLLDRLSKGPERYLDIRLNGEYAAINTSIGGELRVEVGLHARERRPYIATHFAKGGKAVLQDGIKSVVLAKEGMNPFADATAALLDCFLRAIHAGQTPPGDARDHRKTLALVFAAYDSAARRQCVELEPCATSRL
jgi:D-apiose dehydrogenase